jgi:hypothetical protein
MITLIHHLYPIVSDFPARSVSTCLHHHVLPVQQSPGTHSTIPTNFAAFDDYDPGNVCVDISNLDWKEPGYV